MDILHDRYHSAANHSNTYVLIRDAAKC